MSNEPAWLLSIAPLTFFVLIYLGFGVPLGLPPAACALGGLAFGLLLNVRNLEPEIAAFIKGAREETVIYMCLIFLLAGAFSSVSKESGGLISMVNIGLTLMPQSFMLPGLFVVASVVSLAMGTSMGTIATIAPIGVAIADAAGADLALTMGAILSGAMFGDNLSVISDTTIAATGTMGCDMRSKMRANLPLALLSAALSIGLFSLKIETLEKAVVGPYSLLAAFPYFLVLALAVMGFNVVAVLITGIFTSAFIGYLLGAMSGRAVWTSINTGFLDMSEIFFLSILVAGLSGIAMRGSAINQLIGKLHLLVRGKRSAELVISLMVSVVDICVANNTIAILVSGKVAKEMTKRYSLSAARVASLLDIFSCVWQGLLPYGAQILLLSSLCALKPTTLVAYSWYPMVLGVVSFMSICLQFPKSTGKVSNE